jgi:hypothetical protein
MLYRAYNEKYYELFNQKTFREVSFRHVTIGLLDNLQELDYSIHNRIVDSKVISTFKETGVFLKLPNDSKGRFIKIIDRIPGSKTLGEAISEVKALKISSEEKAVYIQQLKDNPIPEVKPIYRFILQYSDLDTTLYKCYEGYRNIYKGVVSEDEYYSLDKRLYTFKEIIDETVIAPTILKINGEYLPFFSLNELEDVYVSKHGSLMSKSIITDKQKCYVVMHQEAMSLLYGNIQKDPPPMLKGY